MLRCRTSGGDLGDCRTDGPPLYAGRPGQQVPSPGVSYRKQQAKRSSKAVPNAMREAARPVGRARDRSPDGEGTRPALPLPYTLSEAGASAERHIFCKIVCEAPLPGASLRRKASRRVVIRLSFCIVEKKSDTNVGG